MATMGLALPWEARISNQEQERGNWVGLGENPGSGLAPASGEARPDDSELAIRCTASE